jgi:hypothetical protein
LKKLLPKNGLKNTLAKSKRQIEKQNFIEEPITQTLKATYHPNIQIPMLGIIERHQ